MTAPSDDHLDLFELAAATVRCPYAALDDLREQSVRFVPHIGAFVVSGHLPVMQVLSDADLFSSRNPTGPHSATALARRIQADDLDLSGLDDAERERLRELARRRAVVAGSPALISADGPLHEEQRRAIGAAFEPERTRTLEPVVAAVADELIAAFVDRGEVELVGEFCRPLSVRVIGGLLGVEDADTVRFERWTRASLLAVGSPALTPGEMLDMFDAIAECYDFFTARLERAQAEPGRDVIGVVAAFESPTRQVSLAERLQILIQTMVAGYETTVNLLSSAVLRLASTPGLEERLRADMSRLPEFVEEVLRIEAPTAGIYRVASRTTRLGGVDIPAGSPLFVAFHAANLDPNAFEAPQEIRFDRPDKPQHLAFGNGVHGCVGASLARVEARIAIETLLRRVRGLGAPAGEDLHHYHRSFATRGLSELRIAFQRNEVSVEAVADAEHRPMVVETERVAAERVLEVVLRAPDGRDLPVWEPGSHIELLLPSGLTRQYSLCGNPVDRARYTIAVLEEVGGRGGSAELHRLARCGAVVQVRPPRNNFPLKPAARYLFIAGGIGVTPILTMVEHAQRAGSEWTFVYGGRSRASMAYVDRVGACSGGTVELWPEDERGRPDLPALLGALDTATSIYACGPTGLLDAVQAAHAQVHGLQPLRFERFAAAGPVDTSGGAFEVVLAKAGKNLIVEEDVSILEIVRGVLPRISYSCEEGYCGECETRVLEGEPDHRDDFLDDEEQAAGDRMMICVSRCRGRRLVLDL